MDMDQFLDRVYCESNYNCGHFVAEVWEYLTGEVLDKQFSVPNVAKEKSFRQKLDAPSDPCLVLMKAHELHVGIFTRGKVLHIRSNGVVHEPIDNITSELSYYR